VSLSAGTTAGTTADTTAGTTADIAVPTMQRILDDGGSCLGAPRTGT
jgi:hypothetical protein